MSQDHIISTDPIYGPTVMDKQMDSMNIYMYNIAKPGAVVGFVCTATSQVFLALCPS